MFRLSIFIFMNKRLTAIASYIKDGRGVIDVGTDHGYLPVYLAKSGYKGRILASDINAAPLSTALRTAERAEIKDKVELLLCDGLEKCPSDAVDSIVIAGMGGGYHMRNPRQSRMVHGSGLHAYSPANDQSGDTAVLARKQRI